MIMILPKSLWAQLLPVSLLWDDDSSASVGFKCTLISNLVFWPVSILGLYIDHLCYEKRNPILLNKYKLRPDQCITRTRDKIDLILLSSFNIIFVAFFICCPLYEWLWNRIQGEDGRLKESDEFIWQYELLLKIPIHILATEIGFYSVHYLLHYSPFLYRYIHKVHHRFTSPTSMCCVYAHPIEFALGNLLPIYIGPIICNSHPFTCYGYWFLAMLGTCKGHCGYRILGYADHHDEHHLYYKYNYGGMYISDYFLGTTSPPPPPPAKKN